MRGPEGQTGQDPIEELLAAYALNAVEPHERAVVELVLAQDDRYQGLLAQYMEAAATLSSSYSPLMPSPGLRQRVLDAIRSKPSGLGRPVRFRAGHSLLDRVPLRIWTTAAVLVLAVGALASFSAYQQGRVHRLEDQLGSTQERLLEQEKALSSAAIVQQKSTEQLAAEIGWTKEQLQLARAAFYWAALPGVETIVLEPSSLVEATGGPRPRAMFMMTPDRKAALLIAVGLPSVKAESAYQAWLWEHDGTPVSAAVFAPDPTGYVQLLVRIEKELAAYRGVSISTEPAGGSARPNGAPVLSGLMASP
jgi:anti-sigma-K factor RskA